MIGSIIMMALGIFLMIGRTFLPGTVIIILGIIISLYSRYHPLINKMRTNTDLSKVRTNTDLSKVCMCSICNHKKSKICIDSRCHCCIIIKEDTVVGHHNSPLQ